VVVPTAVLDRLGRHERREDQARAGVELAVEQVRWAKRDGWAGVYLMSPGGHEAVIDVLQGGLG
jgi:hypothetical protein